MVTNLFISCVQEILAVIKGIIKDKLVICLQKINQLIIQPTHDKQKQLKYVQTKQYQVFFPNKNYKHRLNLMTNLANSLLLMNGPFINSNFASSSAILPPKLNTTSHIAIVRDETEELELLSSLVWRQNTSMPIIKILSFKNEGITFPKSYCIEVEYIEKPVKNLWGVQLKDCLYLIRQCLQGVQALHYKYNQFDFHEIFYGINELGQCKVWISEQFGKHQNKQMPLPKQDIIIGHILKMIYNISDLEAKKKLFPFMHETALKMNIEYSEFHINLCEFSNKNKILIPPCLNLQRRSNIILATQSQIFKKASLSLDHGAYKVSFRYQSPAPKSVSRRGEYNTASLRYSKNNTIFDNQNSSINYGSLESRIQNVQATSYEFIVHPEQKPKDISKMLSSPNRLKERLKQSKNSLMRSSIKTSTKDIKSVKQYENQMKSEKTCTSLTMNNNDQDLLNSKILNRSTIKSGCQIGRKLACSSTFQSTTNISEGQEMNEKAHHTGQKFGEGKDYQNQPMSFHYQNFMKFTSNGYDFGGLLPLPQKSVKHSQYIQEHTINFEEQKSLKIPLKNDRRKHLQSMVFSSTNVPTQMDWGWAKMSKLLTEDTDNLKQSVYCGEQKKPEPLQIKLEMLGRLGREITSMIPESHQHHRE